MRVTNSSRVPARRRRKVAPVAPVAPAFAALSAGRHAWQARVGRLASGAMLMPSPLRSPAALSRTLLCAALVACGGDGGDGSTGGSSGDATTGGTSTSTTAPLTTSSSPTTGDATTAASDTPATTDPTTGEPDATTSTSGTDLTTSTSAETTGPVTTDTEPGTGSTTGAPDTSDTGTSTGAPLECPIAPDDNACETCSKTNCCDELMACGADAKCMCFIDCVQMGNTPQMCAGMCQVQQPGMNPAIAGLFMCNMNSCGDVCM